MRATTRAQAEATGAAVVGSEWTGCSSGAGAEGFEEFATLRPVNGRGRGRGNCHAVDRLLTRRQCCPSCAALVFFPLQSRYRSTLCASVSRDRYAANTSLHRTSNSSIPGKNLGSAQPAAYGINNTVRLWQ